MSGQAFVRAVGRAIAVRVLVFSIAQAGHLVALAIVISQVDNSLFPAVRLSSYFRSPIRVARAVIRQVTVRVPEVKRAQFVLFPVVRAKVHGVATSEVYRILCPIYPPGDHVVPRIRVQVRIFFQ